MRKGSGAAQAVALLIAAVGSTVEPMSNCSDCGGPITRCPACGHWHCDDDGCIPVACARALEED